MGHRASYAIVRDGRTSLYSSHWGALTLFQAIFYSPEHTLAYVQSLEPADALYDEVWCEGAVVIDVDVRRLLWFVSDTRYRAGLRRHLIRLLAQNWHGWEIRWADGDIAEIAIALGIDPSAVRDESVDDRRFTKPGLDELGDHEFVSSLITLRRLGVVEDHGFWPRLTQLLALGPGLIEVCGERFSVSITEYKDLEAGALIDEQSHQVWVWWDGTEDDRRVEQIARYWSGWVVRRQFDGLRGQVALSGRDPSVLDMDKDEVLRRILELLEADSAFDPTAFLAHHVTRGEQIVSIAPGFLRLDKPDLDAHEKQVILARAIEAWRRG